MSFACYEKEKNIPSLFVLLPNCRLERVAKDIYSNLQLEISWIGHKFLWGAEILSNLSKFLRFVNVKEVYCGSQFVQGSGNNGVLNINCSKSIVAILHHSNFPIVPGHRLPAMLRNARRSGAMRTNLVTTHKGWQIACVWFLAAVHSWLSFPSREKSC